MTLASDEFEALVERIVRLAQIHATDVVRDDFIPDPDDPRRRRQVDVTFKKMGKSIFVECRDHAAQQDVQWVEELIGRKASLDPDQMIGVSSTGFSQLARKKAEAHGILLWEISELRDEEILGWGTSIVAEVGYIKFQNVSICLETPADISSAELRKVDQLFISGGHYSRWLNDIGLQIGKELPSGEASPISVDLHRHPSFILNDTLSRVSRLSLTGLASSHTTNFSVCGARTSHSMLPNDDHLSHVFEFNQNWTELHLHNGNFGWAIDFSKVRFEVNAVFSGRITLDMGVPRVMNRAFIFGLAGTKSVHTVPKLLWRKHP